jgi:hypothetical protein
MAEKILEEVNTANELEEYSKKELDRLASEREEAIKAKGGLPYLGALEVGETSLILQPKVPTDNPDKDGRPRKQFVVKKVEGGEDKAWTVNIKSPLYRDLLGFLPKAPIKLRVIRTGEGKQDTRYTVKAA